MGSEMCIRDRYNTWYVFFSLPFIIFALLFSLPPSRNSDPGPHSRLFSPLPNTVRALHFCRDKISSLSSLADSRRIVRTHASMHAKYPGQIVASKRQILPVLQFASEDHHVIFRSARGPAAVSDSAS